MSDLTQYQVDRLFLLVGANPLPNYVAADLLAKDGATIYLLHSGGAHGTSCVAERLECAIKRKRPQLNPIRWEVHEANSAQIQRKFGEILSAIGQQHSVGLNYTGGTKAMAVHAYQAVKSLPNAVLSYLDARTLSLMIDRSGQSPIPVGESCKLALRELVELHGRQISEPETDTVLDSQGSEGIDFHLLVNTLLALSMRGDLGNWQNWCQENLKKKTNGQMKWKNKTELKQVSLPRDNNLVQPVVGALGNPITLGDSTLPPTWNVCDLAKFLDGRWLEHYVLYCLKKVAMDCRVHECAMGLETTGRKFEFDVAAMRGYQLFAISCTTDEDKSLCKLKLFEAYIRARQLGGDEARVALVCCYPDSNLLQQEIEEAWFTEGRVRVFGRAELGDLRSKLKEWFEAVNGGERVG